MQHDEDTPSCQLSLRVIKIPLNYTHTSKGTYLQTVTFHVSQEHLHLILSMYNKFHCNPSKSTKVQGPYKLFNIDKIYQPTISGLLCATFKCHLHGHNDDDTKSLRRYAKYKLTTFYHIKLQKLKANSNVIPNVKFLEAVAPGNTWSCRE